MRPINYSIWYGDLDYDHRHSVGLKVWFGNWEKLFGVTYHHKGRDELKQKECVNALFLRFWRHIGAA